MKKTYIRALDLKHGRVDMTHGSGGRAMVQLIGELFAVHLDNEWLRQGNDGAYCRRRLPGEARPW
jgi:hydrogenase expression/formation protein HypE